MFNGPVGVRHGQACVDFERAVRVERRGRQMQFIVPGVGQQLHRLSLEGVECTGKVKALHFDVPIAAQTASYGPGSEIGLKRNGPRILLRGNPALGIPPIVAVSVEIPATHATRVRGRTFHREWRLVSRVGLWAIYEHVERAVGMKQADIGIALIREMDPPTRRDVVRRIVIVPFHYRVGHRSAAGPRLQERPRATRIPGMAGGRAPCSPRPAAY